MKHLNIVYRPLLNFKYRLLLPSMATLNDDYLLSSRTDYAYPKDNMSVVAIKTRCPDKQIALGLDRLAGVCAGPPHVRKFADAINDLAAGAV